MKIAVNDIRLEVKEIHSPNFESNTTLRTSNDHTNTEDTVQVGDLIIVDGSLNERRVKLFKDDGCNTKVVSR